MEFQGFISTKTTLSRNKRNFFKRILNFLSTLLIVGSVHYLGIFKFEPKKKHIEELVDTNESDATSINEEVNSDKIMLKQKKKY